MMRAPLTLLLLMAVACSSSPSEDDPIAEVNGIRITVREYVDLLESLKPRDTNLTDQERPHIRNLVLQTLVRRAVILSNAKTQNISVSDEELQEGIKKYKSGYSEQLFNESLLEGMVDESSWKELVRESLLIQKMFDQSKPQIKRPTLEEAHEYFQAHPQLFRRNAQVSALHIVVNDSKKIAEIRGRIASGATTFLAAARESSLGPEAKGDSKGDAKISVEKGTMPDEIDQYLFSGPIDQLSPVIKSPYGYHLFKVIKREPAVNQDFNKQVTEQILKTLYEDRRQAWLDRFEEGLIRSAEIEYNRGLISKL